MKRKIIRLQRKYSPLYRSPNFTLYDICYLLILGTLSIALVVLAGALVGVAIYCIVQLVNTFASLKLLLLLILSLLVALLIGIKIDEFIDEL